MTPPAEVRLTDETMAYMEELMEKAVQKGLSRAMTEETAEAFWAAGFNVLFKVLQEQATRQTGRFVLSGLWGLVRKILVFMLLGWIVYMIGGWALLAKFWHALMGG